MACFWPIKAWIGPEKEAGKVNVVFRRDESEKGEPLYLPCGSCQGCRMEMAKDWALRCMHEASLYENNCFVTLTYDDEHLPEDLSLKTSTWQNFMKSLRKEYGPGIRFFQCGEYGERGRPHHHGLLFNHDFKDKVLFSEQNGKRLYTSEDLSSLWKKGFTTVGAVTFESAGYVARYSMKKVRKHDADVEDVYGLKHYDRMNLETGETWQVKPEFITMSRRPGIGKGWFEKYMTDVFPSDEVYVNGKKSKPPRYYDNLLKSVDKDLFEKLKFERKKSGTKLVEVGSRADGSKILVNDYTDPWRCEVRETCAKQQIKKLIRPMEAVT